MANPYLILAYAFVGSILILYAWSLSRRQARLRKDLEELKNRMQNQPPGRPWPS